MRRISNIVQSHMGWVIILRVEMAEEHRRSSLSTTRDFIRGSLVSLVGELLQNKKRYGAFVTLLALAVSTLVLLASSLEEHSRESENTASPSYAFVIIPLHSNHSLAESKAVVILEGSRTRSFEKEESNPAQVPNPALSKEEDGYIDGNGGFGEDGSGEENNIQSSV